MTSTSTRRAFLKVGAVAAAPLAAAGGAAAMAAHDQQAKLARLQDEHAIGALHQAWLRRINTGAHAEAAELFADPKRARFDEKVSGVAADHAAEPDRITLAADGQGATGRYHCVVETQTERPRDCTLAQMAHAQGEGLICRTEPRVLQAAYVKTEGGWAIETLRFEPA
jgi:hypothetical protein